jgi:hypothetical protein
MVSDEALLGLLVLRIKGQWQCIWEDTTQQAATTQQAPITTPSMSHHRIDSGQSQYGYNAAASPSNTEHTSTPIPTYTNSTSPLPSVQTTLRPNAPQVQRYFQRVFCAVKDMI